MARALSREEQLVLNYVRRQGASIPVPDLAQHLDLSEQATDTICAYLVERKLLAVSIYAVAPPAARSGQTEPAVLSRS